MTYGQSQVIVQEAIGNGLNAFSKCRKESSDCLLDSHPLLPALACTVCVWHFAVVDGHESPADFMAACIWLDELIEKNVTA